MQSSDRLAFSKCLYSGFFDCCFIWCINILTEGQLESSAIQYHWWCTLFSVFFILLSMVYSLCRSLIDNPHFSQVWNLALKTIPFMFNIPKVPNKAQLYCHTPLGVQNIASLPQFLFWYAASKDPGDTLWVVTGVSVCFLIKSAVWARQAARVLWLLRKVNTNDCLHLKGFGGSSVSYSHTSSPLKLTHFEH